MPALTIELPTHAERTEFNLHRWAELLDDPELARIEGRIETDRHGHILMSPLRVMEAINLKFPFFFTS